MGWTSTVSETLPDISSSFMSGGTWFRNSIGACDSSDAIKAFGEAGITLVRQRFAGDVFPYMSEEYTAVHRGGALVRGRIYSTAVQTQQLPSLVDE